MTKKQKMQVVSDINIPEDPSAEKTAIGALIDGAWRNHIGTVQEDWFNGVANLDLLRAMNTLVASGNVINIETLFRELKKSAVSNIQKWPSYINECLEASPSPSSFPYYRDILIEKANARQWHKLALEVLGKIGSGESPEDFADSLTNELIRVLGDSGSISVKTESERIEDCYHEIVEMSKGQRKHKGIQTGFPKLDAILQGLQPGNLIVIGARPSIGKSALAFQMLLNVVEKGIPCGFFSLEMRFEDFIRRAFANLSNLSMSNVGDGTLTPVEISKLRKAADKLKAGSLYVDDRPKVIPQIRAKARLWTEFKDVKLLVIDYLQLAKMGGRYNSRYEEISDISQNLKQMAMELGIPVIVLAQLNREAEKFDQPTMSNLKESGQLEQDGDVVILLKRTGADPNEFSRKQIMAFVDKNRQGATGEVCLSFDGRFMRFTELGDQAA